MTTFLSQHKLNYLLVDLLLIIFLIQIASTFYEETRAFASIVN